MRDGIMRDQCAYVPDVGGGVEASFSSSERLKEVGPEGAFVGVRHTIETGAKSADVAGDLIRKHGGRQGVFDDEVPVGVPERLLAEFGFLYVDRGGCGVFGGIGRLGRVGLRWRLLRGSG